MISEYILKSGGYRTSLEDREKISMMSGTFGLVLNILLSILKVVIGLMTGSISVLADAINNISDSFSSVITIISAKMANLPPDKKHPYGHGRIEYIAALIVSAMIVFVGAQFVKSSFDRIRNPKPIYFNIISFIILSISIAVKFYMNIFYKKIAKAINSAPLKAAATDAIADVLITIVVLISLIIGSFISIPIDGYIGMAVSIFIIYAGVDLIRDTVSTLIGEAPSPDFLEKIHDTVCSYEGIINVHDIIVNSYGPEKKFVVLDAEVPYYMDLIKAHDIVDKIEREVSEELDVHLIVHIDPVGNESGEELRIIQVLNNIIDESKELFTFHDLRVEVKEVEVDITVDGNIIDSEEIEIKTKTFIVEKLKEKYPEYKYIINLDKRY